MPIVYESESYIILHHTHDIYESPQLLRDVCPLGINLTLLHTRTCNVVYSPLVTTGTVEPNFSKPFNLSFDVGFTRCCCPQYTSHGGDDNNLKRMVCKYDPKTSSKFTHYFGLDVAVCKFRGDVVVVVEKIVARRDSSVVRDA